MVTTPALRMAPAAWSTLVAELDRVAPAEGLAVPLVALRFRDPGHNPCQAVHLADLAEVAVAAVVLVPPDRQVNRRLGVHVLARTDDVVDAEVQRLLVLHPRLRTCAYLHSHPFAVGRTWPSGGTGDVQGHMVPLLRRNRETGLHASFSLIACRLDRGGWRLQGFALDDRERVVDLGDVVVGDVAWALDPRLTSRPGVRGVLRRWRRGLHRGGHGTRVDRLFDGWLRLVVDADRDPATVVLLPPGFPGQEAQCFRVTGSPAVTQAIRQAPERVVQEMSVAGSQGEAP
jgi:hypothetical protein